MECHRHEHALRVPRRAQTACVALPAGPSISDRREPLSYTWRKSPGGASHRRRLHTVQCGMIRPLVGVPERIDI
jgi:hypothetical protein